MENIVNRAEASDRAAIGEVTLNRALEMQVASLLVLPYLMAAKPTDELFVKAIRSSSDVGVARR